MATAFPPASLAPPSSAPAAVGGTPPASAPPRDSSEDPVLCSHCGRTAGNGISCQGICVADSGY